MGRPKKNRCVLFEPNVMYFKPRGVPLSMLEEVTLSMDELEALRLADYDQLYQEAAALKMKISRQTFGRIVESARKKVAEALTTGKALRIEGNPSPRIC
ncbi:MAG: DUF134 domain-containing protein [Thermodesulfobacteriota bacterium]